MSEQSEITAAKQNSSMLALYRERHRVAENKLLASGAQSYYLSQFLNDPGKWKGSARQSTLLRKMQSRNWIIAGFDIIFLAAKKLFWALGERTEHVLARYIKPNQARVISIYATTILLAVLTLAFCREINLYCFRSIAHSENALGLSKNATRSNRSFEHTHQAPLLSRTSPLL